MPSPLDDLLERAALLECEVERELNRARDHYREFIDYGDATGYQQRLPLLRAKLKDEKTAAEP